MPTKDTEPAGAGGNGIGCRVWQPTHPYAIWARLSTVAVHDNLILRRGLCSIPAPDSYGAYIYGLQGKDTAYETGRRAHRDACKAEDWHQRKGDKIALPIPYGVNKAAAY